MITLSGGALGLSITFLGQIKDQIVECPIFMPVSWICFGTSLCFMLWSYQVSREAYDRQLFVLDKRYFEYSEEDNPLRERPQLIARVAMTFFCIGLLCLSMFGLINAENIMSGKKQEQKRSARIIEQRGNPPRVSPALGKPSTSGSSFSPKPESKSSEQSGSNTTQSGNSSNSK